MGDKVENIYGPAKKKFDQLRESKCGRKVYEWRNGVKSKLGFDMYARNIVSTIDKLFKINPQGNDFNIYHRAGIEEMDYIYEQQVGYDEWTIRVRTKNYSQLRKKYHKDATNEEE